MNKDGNYRFRRFQALSDALEIYFDVMLPYRRSWFTTRDICDAMEWPVNPTSQKRAIRLCLALKRVGRLERNTETPKGTNKGAFRTSFWRVIQ